MRLLEFNKIIFVPLSSSYLLEKGYQTPVKQGTHPHVNWDGFLRPCAPEEFLTGVAMVVTPIWPATFLQDPYPVIAPEVSDRSRIHTIAMLLRVVLSLSSMPEGNRGTMFTWWVVT